MKKKFIISLLATIAYVCFALFFISQAAADPAIQLVKVYHCDSGELLRAVKDPDTHQTIAAYGCEAQYVSGPGQCSSWVELTPYNINYYCDSPSQSDCRLQVYAQDSALCGSIAWVAGKLIFK